MEKIRLDWKRIFITAGIALAAIAIAATGLIYLSDRNRTQEEAPVIAYPEREFYSVEFAPYRLAEGVPLMITASSVERDLSIYIMDEDFQVIKNVSFEVVATGPSGEEFVFTDEEASGKIQVNDLEPGEYTLTIRETGRFLVPEPITVDVKDKVELKVIDNIGEKIVNSKNVDAPSEDAAYSGRPVSPPPPPPPTLTDTIAYYESKTITTENEIEVTVELKDSNGNPVIKYQPYLNELGEFMLSNNDPSTHTPALDGEGFLLTTDLEVFDENGLPRMADDGNNTKYWLISVPQYTTETQIEIVITYQGWQTLDGKQYYYDLQGDFVTGSQVIQGVAHTFDSNGVLQPKQTSQKLTGIDISTYQPGITWQSVKNSGIHFAMIRAGYRGYGTGVLVEDNLLKSHVLGANSVGIKIGLYYFSQAINTVEAVEEASACVNLARKYGVPITYPLAIDIEYVSSSRIGRADWLTGVQRTEIAEAFCETIRNAGYTPMIYSSMSWFQNDSYLITSRLAPKYHIWLAHWGVEQTSYKGRYDMWQYTSNGTVPGIPGRVDMNVSYLGF